MQHQNFIKIGLICFLAFGFGFFQPANAQQIPLYSQYYFSPFIYNPSYTGATGELNSRLMYRRQWTGFEGAPETRIVTMDGALADGRVGLGGYVYNDITDIFERFSGYLAYAYHLPLGEEHRISFGLAAGVQDNSIDFERIKVKDADDPLLSNNNFRSTAFDAGLGVNYSWNEFNIGFSVPQVIETELRHLNTKDHSSYSLARHYLLNASYRFYVWDDRISLQPLLMFRTTSGNPFQVDINALAGYKDIAWIGVSYRYDYAMTFSAAFRVHEMVQVGYAYDHAVNNISNYSGGTHEIMVGIRFGRKEKAVPGVRTESAPPGPVRIDHEELARQDSIIQQLVLEVDSVKKALSERERIAQQREEEIRELMQRLEEIGIDYVDAETGESIVQTMEVETDDLEFIEGEVQQNYYLVVGAFSVRANAQTEYQRLTDAGYNAGVVFDRSRGFNYVFIAEPDTVEEGMEILQRMRDESGEFQDAWIHIIR